MGHDQGTVLLGLDIGTSAVKTVLADMRQTVMASTTVPLDISRPRPGWSEQEPQDWIAATHEALEALKDIAPKEFAMVRAIGLSGQMHGAVLLGADDRLLRPAILWNDGRAEEECAEMLAAMPDLPMVAGVPPMPGLTAPKLLWLRKREPETFGAIRTVLCPKDFVRLHLTGARVTDMSDAAGTLWLDQARRRWSDAALAASGLAASQMPRLAEGTEISGEVRAELCAELGWAPGVIVAGGAGDAAAAAVGLGAIGEGDAFISLGTSCQVFASSAHYRPKPETLVHAFAHCVPDRWFQMAAMLNGASCLSWVASTLGRADIEALLGEVVTEASGPGEPLFLPYLAGERTPHNDTNARGVFFGLGQGTTAAGMTRAVLEGVAYSIREARDVLASAGTPLSAAGLTGGGTRSAFWLQMISDVTGLALWRPDGTELGPAFGAARLARLALTGEPVETVCTKPPVKDWFVPDARLADAYALGFARYRSLYTALKPEFRRAVAK